MNYASLYDKLKSVLQEIQVTLCRVGKWIQEDFLGKYIKPRLNILEQNQVQPTILEEVQLALGEWQAAKQTFDYADKDAVDYAVYRLNATERKYVFLLNEAKNEGIKAWDFPEKDE